MSSDKPAPTLVHGLDVSLQDVELDDEVHLLVELIAAVNRFGSHLSSNEIDALLGL